MWLSPTKKFCKTPSQWEKVFPQWKKLSACHPSEGRKGKIGSQYSPAQAKSESLSQKYPMQKRAGGVAQTVERLPIQSKG
jgi:hypothetical protein